MWIQQKMIFFYHSKWEHRQTDMEVQTDIKCDITENFETKVFKDWPLQTETDVKVSFLIYKTCTNIFII